jgi:hypothetical protein
MVSPVRIRVPALEKVLQIVENIGGIGNRKNALFNEVLRLRDVEVFETSVALIRELSN